MKVVAITSPLHKESAEDPSKEPFIQSIEALLEEKIEFCSCDSAIEGLLGNHDSAIEVRLGIQDSSVNGKSGLILFVYVRTGGTEGIFNELIHSYLSCNTQSEPAKIILITSGESNSLAASMEILSYLQGMGLEGEILHGSPEFIAGRIKAFNNCHLNHSSQSEQLKRFECVAENSVEHGNGDSFVRKFESVNLGGARLGVIGRPSDWLISSNVDYAKAKERMNVELVDIPMDELLGCINSISTVPIDMRSFRGSEIIYEALNSIVNKYGLKGLTLRCFDLLDTVHNTGCLALARLNAEGIAACCEGDVPALLSMYYLLSKRGCPGFQCNLSSINGDELLFAHCTVPLSMVDSYRYMTHFESGIGTAIKGEMPLGRVEIFKIAPDLERCVTIAGEIVENKSKPNLCRTQIVVKAPGAAKYFLHSPLANHHIISYL